MIANLSADPKLSPTAGESERSSDETGEMGSWPALPRL